MLEGAVMTFDFTINLSVIIALVGFAAAGVAAWVSMRGTVQSHGLKLLTLETELKIARERAEEIRAKTAKELADYQLVAAEKFATNAAIKEVEERVVAAIERLGDRLDKFVDASRRRPPS